MFKFEKLDVWKKAVSLYEDVHKSASSIGRDEQFSLGEQIRRAYLSLSTNIAEGTGRDNDKEAKYFYNVAKGSIYEVVSLLHVMKARSYLASESHGALYGRCDEIARMLTGLINANK